MKQHVKEVELFFLPRLWGIPSVFWHPDLLNSGKPQALVFPYWLNSSLPFRKKIPLDLSPCHRGRVRVYVGQLRSQLPHFDRIRSGSEASHSCFVFFFAFSHTIQNFCLYFWVTSWWPHRLGGQRAGILPKATEGVGTSSSWAYIRVVQAVFNCKLLGDKSQCTLLALKIDYTPLSEFDGEGGRDSRSKNTLIK